MNSNVSQPATNQASDQAPHAEYLKSLSLKDALWWFIENVNDEDPHRNDYFFALRERVKTEEPPRPQVGLRIEGGIIQSAFSDVPVDLSEIDYDCEGSNEDELFPMPQDDDNTTTFTLCHLREYSTAVMPVEIKRIVEAIEAHEANLEAESNEAASGVKP